MKNHNADSECREEALKRDFFNANTLQANNWDTNLKDRMREYIRAMFDPFSKEIAWVNPIARIVPRRPEAVFEAAPMPCEPLLTQSLFLPTAIKANDQPDLDAAYRAITEHVSEESHATHSLTHVLESLDYRGSYCFLCQREPHKAPGTVEISACRCLAEQPEHDQRGALVCAGHFDSLFKITQSNTFFFIPHRLLSISGAKSGIYEHYLVGMYVGLNEHTEAQRWCPKGAKVKDSGIWESVDRICEWFFIKQFKDQSDLYLRRWQALTTMYKKQLQMLALVSDPLHRLTSALSNAQESMHTLNAVLYEPVEGVFAAQADIATLFNENTLIVNPDRSHTAVRHSPHHYDGQPQQAKWVLAHALARLQGTELIGRNAQEALQVQTLRLKEAVENNSDPLHLYVGAIYRLLDLDPADPEAIGCVTNGQDCIDCLSKLKERLFTPFKPDNAAACIKWPVLRSLLPSVEDPSEIQLNGVTTDKFNRNELPVVIANANPLATQGHLLAFISGVVSQQTRVEGGNVRISTEVTGDAAGAFEGASQAIVTFQTTGPMERWIIENNITELADLLGEELRSAQEGIIKNGEYGDFRRSYIKLIRRCQHGAFPRIEQQQSALTLAWDHLELKFEKENFTVTSSIPYLGA